jgi:hypothetical protein
MASPMPRCGSQSEKTSMRGALLTATAMLPLWTAVLPAAPALAGYGAIAWDKAAGRSGWSWNQSTADKAKEVALSHCGSSGCKVVMESAAKQCFALATTQDRKHIGAARRNSQDDARVAALANCRKDQAGECFLRFSECNK